MPAKTYTVQEAARVLGVRPVTVRYHLAKRWRALAGEQVGNRRTWHLTGEDLEHLRSRRGKVGRPTAPKPEVADVDLG